MTYATTQAPTSRELCLTSMAALMGLTVRETVVLPVSVAHCAGALAMTEASFLGHLAANEKLRAYIAGTIRKVAGESNADFTGPA